jgi:hypothetical protein
MLFGLRFFMKRNMYINDNYDYIRCLLDETDAHEPLVYRKNKFKTFYECYAKMIDFIDNIDEEDVNLRKTIGWNLILNFYPIIHGILEKTE